MLRGWPPWSKLCTAVTESRLLTGQIARSTVELARGHSMCEFVCVVVRKSPGFEGSLSLDYVDELQVRVLYELGLTDEHRTYCACSSLTSLEQDPSGW